MKVHLIFVEHFSLHVTSTGWFQFFFLEMLSLIWMKKCMPVLYSGVILLCFLTIHLVLKNFFLPLLSPFSHFQGPGYHLLLHSHLPN